LTAGKRQAEAQALGDLDLQQNAGRWQGQIHVILAEQREVSILEEKEGRYSQENMQRAFSLESRLGGEHVRQTQFYLLHIGSHFYESFLPSAGDFASGARIPPLFHASVLI
jgi:hypothetical protein